MPSLVITPCGARKGPAPARADRLYTGPYFIACMRYALTLAPPDRIRILSAKHGLIPVDRVLHPYDLRFGMPGTVTPGQLRDQAIEQGILDVVDVVVLGGREYTSRALQVWPDAETPLTGVAGRMVHQVQALNRWTREARTRVHDQ